MVDFAYDVTLLTCTGMRPEAFNLCCRYVARMKLGALSSQWVVIDDSLGESLDVEWFAAAMQNVDNVVTLRGVGDQPYCTMPLNVHTALDHCHGKLLVFIEDDDWYSEGYVARLFSAFSIDESRALIGFSQKLYYNVRERSFLGSYSPAYASLCRTAVGSLPTARARLREVAYKTHADRAHSVDTTLWGSTPSSEGKQLLQGLACLSIKGMPGRSGAGILHSTKFPNSDKTYAQLSKWIGNDVELYKEFAK